MGNGAMILSMVGADWFYQLDKVIKENFSKDKNMEQGCIDGILVTHIQAVSVMINVKD